MVDLILFGNIFLVVRPGEPAWKEIREEFGQDVFGTDGELDREVLGKIIFSDVNKRTRLNRITHPKIQKEMIIAIIKHFLAGNFKTKVNYWHDCIVLLVRAQVCCAGHPSAL